MVSLVWYWKQSSHRYSPQSQQYPCASLRLSPTPHGWQNSSDNASELAGACGSSPSILEGCCLFTSISYMYDPWLSTQVASCHKWHYIHFSSLDESGCHIQGMDPFMHTDKFTERTIASISGSRTKIFIIVDLYRAMTKLSNCILTLRSLAKSIRSHDAISHAYTIRSYMYSCIGLFCSCFFCEPLETFATYQDAE